MFYFIGIDPGYKGGVAAISVKSILGIPSVNTFAIPMPLIKIGNKKKEINIEVIADLLEDFIRNVGRDNMAIAIERVSAMPNQGVTSMFNFGSGYGELKGMLKTLKLKYLLVPPQVWKKHILTDTKRDKAAAIGYVKSAYPNFDLSPGRLRNPHDGMADAICLADYMRLVYDHENKDI